ncbi:unnamed protein product [Heterobilharzia americana]|nr:unnamed protein product [Heterobilharzia americana]
MVNVVIIEQKDVSIKNTELVIHEFGYRLVSFTTMTNTEKNNLKLRLLNDLAVTYYLQMLSLINEQIFTIYDCIVVEEYQDSKD